MKGKLLSIIVPVYHSEEFLPRCLESILECTYQNFEIIVMDDASDGDAEEICSSYDDKRIRYFRNKKNMGLYCNRIIGVDHAKGEYIAFLDSDDHVSVDFYRRLIEKAEKTDSDIVIGEYLLEYSDGTYKECALAHTRLLDIDVRGSKIIELLLNQSGADFSLHITPNKVYRIDLWQAALPYLKRQKEHLIQCEDVVFSCLLYYFAKHVTNIHGEFLYYVKHSGSATVPDKSRFGKNIHDINIVFKFLEKLFRYEFKQENAYKKILEWDFRIKGLWKKEIENADLSADKKMALLDNMVVPNLSVKKISPDNFYGIYKSFKIIPTEELKRKIASPEIRTVSFDVFDTLLVRPFLEPNDLFDFLDMEASKEWGMKDRLYLKQRRIDAEWRARQKISKEDITLDDIYMELVDVLNISCEQADYLKAKEMELEERFVYKRKFAKEIYEMALALGKQVVMVSDMYLPKSLISRMLAKNGFEGILYVSSEIGLTKASGSLYKYVAERLKLDGHHILHIGDNMQSDVKMAQKQGWQAFFLPKTADLMRGYVPEIYEGKIYKEIFQKPYADRGPDGPNGYLGLRCLLGVVANKIFDNPLLNFHPDSDFDTDPRTLGYFALGMYIYGIGTWLKDEVIKEKYDNIHFVARDGYLPMQAFDILWGEEKNDLSIYYSYFTRSSIMPLQIHNAEDFHSMSQWMGVASLTPGKMVKIFEDFIAPSKVEMADKLCENAGFKYKQNFGSVESFDRFVKFFVKHFYQPEKFREYQEQIGKILAEKFKGKTAVFDVGYSCRSESALKSNYGFDITPYYIHINNDIPYYRAMNSEMNFHTFYAHSPGVTGLVRELMISKTAPSCEKIRVVNGNAVPIFKQYSQNYYRDYIVNIMQESALSFVRDVCHIFEGYRKYLFCQREDLGLVYERFNKAPREIDKAYFATLLFEDDMGLGKTFDLVEFWNKRISACREVDGEEMNADSGTIELLKNRNYSWQLGEDIYGRFVFPWKLVRPGSKIVIYGGGVVGKTLLEQLSRCSYCTVTALVDKNPEATGIVEMPVITPDELAGLDDDLYDRVIIAIERKSVAKDIREELLMAGIPAEKIKWVNLRRDGVILW